MFIYFSSPIDESAKFEDANNASIWKVWNGVAWKPASHLNLDAILKLNK